MASAGRTRRGEVTRAFAAGALALAVLTSASTAVASNAAPSPPPGVNYEASIVDLDPSIVALESSIEPLETTSTEGAEKVVTLNSDILFAFDKAVITPAAVAKIGELVKPLPKGAKVSVGGHTDSLGTAARNATLSQQRAQAVADVVKKARPDLVLTVKGFGSSQPVEPNEEGGKDNPDGRAKNRRVELRYTG